MGMVGVQLLESSLLPPRDCISSKLELKARARIQFLAHSGGVWASLFLGLMCVLSAKLAASILSILMEGLWHKPFLTAFSDRPARWASLASLAFRV